jgi:hypothetical protein
VLFSTSTAKKEHAVRGFMLSLINNNCQNLRGLDDGPRLESRVSLIMVVLVVPWVKKRPVVDQAFAALTRDLGSQGVSLVLNEPCGVSEVVLAFQWDGEMRFVLAEAKHLSPMGGGFYQLGLHLKEMIHPSDYPALQSLRI